MADDDLLDDLGDVPDFGFGYDDSLGDPNVKPRPPPAPTEDAAKRTSSSLTFSFPKQNQFLTRLVLQVAPTAPPGTKNAVDPFLNFSKSAADNREIVITTDAPTIEHVEATGLNSGTYYAGRLIISNPSGTAVGPASEPLLTAPSAPPAPRCDSATTNSASLNFPPQGQHLNKLVIEVMMDNGSGAPFAKGSRAFAAQISTPAVADGVNITNLEPGKRYFARLRARNPAGEALGPSNEGFVTLPELMGLGEDHSQRTDKQVYLKFEPIGSYITDLVAEYVQVVGDAKPVWNKAETKTIPEPQTASGCLIDKLQSAKTYVFRLRATNGAGVAYSDTLKIDTVEFSPEMLDKSGWLQEMPKVEGKKTLGRRLSMRKNKPKKYWYVLDGKLLTWYTDINGEEVGFLHLGKIVEIVGDEYSEQTTSFELQDKDKNSIHLLVESTDPNVSSNELCISWIKTLKAAWRPSKAPSRHQSINENPLKDKKAEEPASPTKGEVAMEEVTGFGDFDEEEEDNAMAEEKKQDGQAEGQGAASGDAEGFGFD